MSSLKEKDPNATLDYFVDWKQNGWLGSDTIVTSAWTVPADLTNVAQSVVDGRCTVWLSGGTEGSTYEVVNHITTNSTPARQDERTLYIKVIDR